MGGPFGKLKLADKPPQGFISKGPLIHTFSAQIVFNCTCGGHDAPIMIHLIPGLESKPTCPACKTQYYLAELGFSAKEANAKVLVGMNAPAIAPPASIITP